MLNWLRKAFSFGGCRSLFGLNKTQGEVGGAASNPVVPPAAQTGSTEPTIKILGLPSLGQILFDSGIITSERLDQARAAHKAERRALGDKGATDARPPRLFADLLVEDGYVTRADVEAVLLAIDKFQRTTEKRIAELMGKPLMTCNPPVPEIRRYGLRFDMEVIGQNHRKPAKATHWTVRITSHPGGGLPLVVGAEYQMPVELFNYSMFLGDHVEAEWDGERYAEFSTFKHGWSPDKWPGNAAEARALLKLFHAETLATAEIPLNHVAGRSTFAAYLLDRVMGEISIWRDYPRDALSSLEQADAVLLAAAVQKHLTVARIEQVSRASGSHAEGCRRLIAAAKHTDLNRRLSDSKRAMYFLHTHLPSRRPSRQEVESIGRMFAMAAQADQNYGRGTGDRLIETLCTGVRPAGGIIQ